MKCEVCKTQIAAIEKAFEGFMCPDEHLQCLHCNFKNYDKCGQCGAPTDVIHINKKKPKVDQMATTADLYANSNFEAIEDENESSLMISDESSNQMQLTIDHSKMNQTVPKEAELKAEVIGNQKAPIDFSMRHLGKLLIKPEAKLLVGDKQTAASKACEFEDANELQEDRSKYFESPNIQQPDLQAPTGDKQITPAPAPKPLELEIINESQNDVLKFLMSQIVDLFNHRNSSHLAGTSPVLTVTSQQPNNVTQTQEERLVYLMGKILDLFNRQNLNYHKEVVVENSYDFYAPPAWYQLPQNHCELQWNLHEQQPNNMPSPSIGVSTESNPTYVVMQATGYAQLNAAETLPTKDKFDEPSLDNKMQTILKTLRENPEQQTPRETEKFCKKFFRPQNQHSPQSLQQDKDDEQQEINTLDSSLFTMNTARACYQAAEDFELPIWLQNTQYEPQYEGREPPAPQFAYGPLTKQLLSPKEKSKQLAKPVAAQRLSISREPLHCPISVCQSMVFISDLNKHFVMNHDHLSKERMAPFQCKNFFIDPHLRGQLKGGGNRCHMLYFLTDKITDLGSHEYKDYLPVLIMTAPLTMADMGLVSHEESKTKQEEEFLLIWVTGITSKNLCLSVTLTLWSRSGQTPNCHLLYSGDMYPIRNSQKALDVWKSGHMLMLSSAQVEQLTNGGKDMMNVQLEVH
uniref:DUF4729 domain-containing protein n=1 Tax=Stomoxys calcitrans TaxID=35570 RepID=A0A1I8PD03_STOCA